MNEQHIKQALNRLADQAVPENYDPFSTVKKDIESVLRLPKKHKPPFPRHLRLAGFAILTLTLIGVLFMMTPEGKGVAQAVARFFSFADQDTVPIPTGLPTEPAHPTRTAAPTQNGELQVVTPAVKAADVSSYPTKTPIATIQSDRAMWYLSLEQAGQLAGYEVRVPASLPEGYRLDNVIYDPSNAETAQFYKFYPYSAGEMFILSQRSSPPVDVIGKSALVEQISLGDLQVEYVDGGWFGEPGSGVETWSSGSIYHTFRWQEGDFYFAMVFMFDDADTWSPAYWTKEDMLAMVEVVMGLRTEDPQQVNYNNLTSISQAEQVAGFKLLVPATLPEGFVLTRGAYQPELGRVILYYQPQAGGRAVSGVNLLIIESLRSEGPWSWDAYPPSAVEAVLLGSLPGTFVQGEIVDGVYNPEGQVKLVWSNDQLTMQLIYSYPPDYPVRLDMQQLLAIAISMQ